MQLLVDYEGRKLSLTDERLTHIRDHPEMRGLEGAIAAAVGDPELVIQSQSDAHVHLYYRLQRMTPPGEKWMCVVAKVGRTDGFVITAYLTDQPKAGVILWSRKP